MSEATQPPAIPTIAIMGHPNVGKSSVVSTLAERDEIVVSPLPGTTVLCGRFDIKIDGREILRFIDTPGFQNPLVVREWFVAHHERHPQPARQFIREHEGDPALQQDCELLRPLAEGAAVMFVVDAGGPVREQDRAEIEILRLAGCPRMAVVNPKEEQPELLEDWKRILRKDFTFVRVFNAHRACYEERLGMLQDLERLDQSWNQRLAEVIDAYQRDWRGRLEDCAGIIADYLRDCLAWRESAALASPAGPARLAAELRERYQDSLRRKESDAMDRVRQIFRHRRWKPDLTGHPGLGADLFSTETFQLFGLSRTQLILAGVVSGAAAGAGLDVLLAGHSLGLGALIGAAVGGAVALAGGLSLGDRQVLGRKISQRAMTVGPNRHPQFPWILLDRMLLMARLTMRQPHGRREASAPPASVPSPEAPEKQGILSTLPEDAIRRAARHLKRGKADDWRALRELLAEWLENLSQSTPPRPPG
jgi:hypothetical protein